MIVSCRTQVEAAVLIQVAGEMLRWHGGDSVIDSFFFFTEGQRTITLDIEKFLLEKSGPYGIAAWLTLQIYLNSFVIEDVVGKFWTRPTAVHNMSRILQVASATSTSWQMSCSLWQQKRVLWHLSWLCVWYWNVVWLLVRDHERRLIVLWRVMLYLVQGGREVTVHPDNTHLRLNLS
jgi:hypothetical protein